MSSIVIRNIVGTGPFQTPTTPDDLDSMDAEVVSIVKGIADLVCLEARGQAIAPDGGLTEIIAIIGSFSYLGSIVPDTTALRITISTAFLANANVTSIGDIEIKLVQEGGFYNRYPEIDRVDDITGIVYFTKEAPIGAQIEVCKYTPHPTGPHASPTKTFTSRIGKRYRPDRLLAKGATSCDLAGAFRQHRRTHFRFAYRWPVPDNTGGPGVRGPLNTTTISSAVPNERTHGSLLIINPAPSGMGRH